MTGYLTEHDQQDPSIFPCSRVCDHQGCDDACRRLEAHREYRRKLQAITGEPDAMADEEGA